MCEMNKSIVVAVCFGMLIGSAAYLLTGWTFSDPSLTQIGWILYSFVAGTFVLGMGLLRFRDFWDSDGVSTNFDRGLWHLLMWVIGLAACAILLPDGHWRQAVAAVLGMVFGSFGQQTDVAVSAGRHDDDTKLKAAADRQREDLKEAAEIASWINVPVDGENPEGWPASSRGPKTAEAVQAKAPPANHSHAAMTDWTRPTQRF